QDAAHGLGRRREEVPPAVPGPGRVRAHQPQVGLVDQRGGLERLAGPLPGQPLGRQFAQLVVDQRQELPGGGGVAAFGGVQDAGDVGHHPRVYRPSTGQANGQADRAVTVARPADCSYEHLQGCRDFTISSRAVLDIHTFCTMIEGNWNRPNWLRTDGALRGDRAARRPALTVARRGRWLRRKPRTPEAAASIYKVAGG